MSALTDRIAAEHQLKWMPPEYVDRACECGLVFKMPMSLSASNVYAHHIANVTEAAVREDIAAECNALWDEQAIRRGRSDPYSEGFLDGIEAAIRVVDQ